MTRLAVVIVNYNSGHLLEACLRSIEPQLGDADRVLVIDNASQDHSESCADRFALCSLHKLKENTGFAAACNFGVAQCTDCEWVLFLNPDTVVDSGFFAAIKSSLARYTAYSSFACRMMKLGQDNIVDGLGDAYHISGRPKRRYHGKTLSPGNLKVQEVFSPCGGAAVYNRAAYLQAGGFDEDYFCYIEDVDLGFRMCLLGFKCLYLPEAVVYHVGSASAGFRSEFQVYYAHRNLVWTYFKNMPVTLLWIFLPFHLMLNIYSIFLYAARGKLGTILKAKLDACRSLPQMLGKRKGGVCKRSVSAWQLVKALSFILK